MTSLAGPEVLDASALLAFLQDERGADNVELSGSLMSTVNYSEALQKALEKGTRIEGLREELELLGLEVVPFDAEHADIAARIHAGTRRLGLSIGDRACLALAKSRGGTAVTTDRAWSEVDEGVNVRLIR